MPTPDGVGDLAADYLDAQRLLDMVYTTWVKRKGSVAERAMNRIRSLSRSSSAASLASAAPAFSPPQPTTGNNAPSPTLGQSGGGEGDGQQGGRVPRTGDEPPTAPTQQLLGKLWSRRTPSYTDRIVFFSLPGAEGRLSSLVYEMADFVGACC